MQRDLLLVGRVALASIMILVVVMLLSPRKPSSVTSTVPRVSFEPGFTEEELERLHPEVRRLYLDLRSLKALDAKVDNWSVALAHANKVEDHGKKGKLYTFKIMTQYGEVVEEEGKPYLKVYVNEGRFRGASIQALLW